MAVSSTSTVAIRSHIMRHLIGLFAVLLASALLAACSSTPQSPADQADAQDPSALVAEAEDAAGSNPYRLVCTEERVTGSRLPRRVCQTEGDRVAAQEDGQRMTRDAQRSPYHEDTGTN
jgi:hypothetical protein